MYKKSADAWRPFPVKLHLSKGQNVKGCLKSGISLRFFRLLLLRFRFFLLFSSLLLLFLFAFFFAFFPFFCSFFFSRCFSFRYACLRLDAPLYLFLPPRCPPTSLQASPPFFSSSRVSCRFSPFLAACSPFFIPLPLFGRSRCFAGSACLLRRKSTFPPPTRIKVKKYTN